MRYATQLGALLLLIGCSLNVPPATPLTEAEIDAAIRAAPPEITYRDEVKGQERRGYEASKWIASSGNFAPFASNHFKSREEALAFVRDLYRLGAASVYAVNIYEEPDRIKSEGGPYSDALYVYLPDDPSQRRALFEVEAREAKGEGFAPSADKGQERFFLWWD